MPFTKNRFPCFIITFLFLLCDLAQIFFFPLRVFSFKSSIKQPLQLLKISAVLILECELFGYNNSLLIHIVILYFFACCQIPISGNQLVLNAEFESEKAAVLVWGLYWILPQSLLDSTSAQQPICFTLLWFGWLNIKCSSIWLWTVWEFSVLLSFPVFL